MVRVARLAFAYAVVGAVATTLFYFLTGVAQFGVDVIGPDGLFPPPRLAHIPDLVVGFLFSRSAVALLEAIALASCVKRGIRAPIVLVIGVGIPVLFEIAVARPYAHSWVGMVWAVLNTWPSVPEHIMPARLVFQTAMAYLAPAALTGVVVSIWEILIERRSCGRLAAQATTADHTRA